MVLDLVAQKVSGAFGPTFVKVPPRECSASNLMAMASNLKNMASNRNLLAMPGGGGWSLEVVS